MSEIIYRIYNRLVSSLGILKAFFWSFFLKRIGKNVEIMERVMIMRPKNVEIGHDVFISKDVKIGGQNGVKIGNYVIIGFNVNLVTANYRYQDPSFPIKKQGFYGGPIKIDSDVWIGANAVILPNVTIGRGSVIGSNSVVTKNVDPYTIVAGVPAKVIKHRFDKSQTDKAKKIDLN